VFGGHCGCALTAKIKKGRYIYYHCTVIRGSPEKYVRKEQMAVSSVKRYG
jgi:hypothetical protein